MWLQKKSTHHCYFCLTEQKCSGSLKMQEEKDSLLPVNKNKCIKFNLNTKKQNVLFSHLEDLFLCFDSTQYKI